MTSKEFRHTHLIKLISEYGSIEKLASATGMNPQHLSQLKNKTRGIGDKTARKIEAGVGWPEGSMDRPPEGTDLDGELAYLLKTMPEEDAINTISEAVPDMSDDGVRILTAALLKRLNAPSDD